MYMSGVSRVSCQGGMTWKYAFLAFAGYSYCENICPPRWSACNPPLRFSRSAVHLKNSLQGELSVLENRKKKKIEERRTTSISSTYSSSLGSVIGLCDFFFFFF